EPTAFVRTSACCFKSRYKVQRPSLDSVLHTSRRECTTGLLSPCFGARMPVPFETDQSNIGAQRGVLKSAFQPRMKLEKPFSCSAWNSSRWAHDLVQSLCRVTATAA